MYGVMMHVHAVVSALHSFVTDMHHAGEGVRYDAGFAVPVLMS